MIKDLNLTIKPSLTPQAHSPVFSEAPPPYITSLEVVPSRVPQSFWGWGLAALIPLVTLLSLGCWPPLPTQRLGHFSPSGQREHFCLSWIALPHCKTRDLWWPRASLASCQNSFSLEGRGTVEEEEQPFGPRLVLSWSSFSSCSLFFPVVQHPSGPHISLHPTVTSEFPFWPSLKFFPIRLWAL